MDTNRAWHTMTVPESLAALETTTHGLTAEEAAARLERFGPNEIEAERIVSPWEILWAQIKNPLVVVLLAAALVSVLTGHSTDAIVIGAVIVVNSAIGFFQEYRAERAIQALRSQAAPEALVLRDCQGPGRCSEVTIKTHEIVPGDVILVEAGNRVPADARVMDARSLQADESMLTGESLPVDKTTAPLPEGSGLAERTNLLYGGTIVTQGRGRALVFATGGATEFGKIATLIQETEKDESPLQRNTVDLGKKLGYLAAAASALTLTIGLLRGYELQPIFFLALASAVSAIPEGLPAVMTITLAVGVSRMAQRNAIIRKLQAVDTLGAATVICSDKTGTLTTNAMTVEQLRLGDRLYRVSGIGFEPDGEITRDGRPIDTHGDPALELALRVGTLCSDAHLSRYEADGGRWQIQGDPTEGALVVAAAKADMSKDILEERYPRIDEVPFRTEQGYMVTFHRDEDGRVWAYVKGKPETVLDLSTKRDGDGGAAPLTDDDRRRVLEDNDAMAQQALRVLGLAYTQVDPDHLERAKEDLEYGRGDLTFVGLVGMIDPPRAEARPAVEQARSAGIRVIMVTGDHRLTGQTIAREVGILDDDAGAAVYTGAEVEAMDDAALDAAVRDAAVFARTSPEHKYRIVEALRRGGEVVAMTGDGINDAPALQASAIGIAMGITGTDVTKETADMVLTDDDFASIVAAVEEGRGVFRNVRKVVKYLLATNFGEILAILTSLVILPVGETIITPVQILWVNLVTDGLLDITIAMEPKEGDVMREPPRRREEPVINREILVNTVFVAIFMAAGTLWMYLRLNSGAGAVHARTVAFTTLAMFQVFNALNVRSRTKSLLQIGPFTNRYLLGAIALSVALQVVATRAGFLQNVLGTTSLAVNDWLWIVAVSSSVFVADELRKLAQRLLRRSRPAPGGTG